MADLPDSELLVRNFVDPTWVRVTFIYRAPFGIFAGTAAKIIAGRIRRDASQFTSAVPISEAEIEGGSFVIDFRITRTVEVGRLRNELAALGKKTANTYGGTFAKLDVTSIERIGRAGIRTETAPARRQETAIEAEESRKETTATPAGIVRGFVGGLKLARGLIVVIIIGAALWVGLPFLKTAGTTLRARRAVRGG